MQNNFLNTLAYLIGLSLILALVITLVVFSFTIFVLVFTYVFIPLFIIAGARWLWLKYKSKRGYNIEYFDK